MRQHVFAFLVAVVLVTASPVLVTYWLPARADESSVLFAKCEQVIGDTVLAIHCYPYPPPPGSQMCGGYCSRWEVDTYRCRGPALQLRCTETLQTLPADWFLGYCGQNPPACNLCSAPWYWQGTQWIPWWRCS